MTFLCKHSSCSHVVFVFLCRAFCGCTEKSNRRGFNDTVDFTFCTGWKLKLRVLVGVVDSSGSSYYLKQRNTLLGRARQMFNPDVSSLMSLENPHSKCIFLSSLAPINCHVNCLELGRFRASCVVETVNVSVSLTSKKRVRAKHRAMLAR